VITRIAASLDTIPANLKGVVLMVLSGACYATMAAVIRGLAADIHPLEMVFFRALFGLIAVLPFFFSRGLEGMRMPRKHRFLLRGATQVGAQMSFYFGITIIPLAAAITLSMTHAIFTAAGAVIFLGEPSVWRRWFAIALGFAGALVIMRPDIGFFFGLSEASAETDMRELGAFLVVLSTVGYAGLTVHSKVLTRTEPISAIITWTLIFSTPLSLILAAFVWVWPTWDQWFFLFLIGALGTMGNATMTNAFKVGEMTALAPVMYVRLVWAALLGFVLFSEIPDMFTGLGAAMIVVAGVYLSRLESRRAKARAATEAADSAKEQV